MSDKKVVYRIYAPRGYIVRTYPDRKQAKAFLDGINWFIPSWHYDELYKMRAEVTENGEICYA
jgi:hypothetical protein